MTIDGLPRMDPTAMDGIARLEASSAAITDEELVLLADTGGPPERISEPHRVMLARALAGVAAAAAANQFVNAILVETYDLQSGWGAHVDEHTGIITRLAASV